MSDPRTWTMPEQPPDVCVVVGKSGHRYKLDDNGDWLDLDDTDEQYGYAWWDLLAGEGELREVLP